MMVDLLLPLCVAFGFLLGIISGLTPGLHINNFAAMLLALSSVLMAEGLSPYHMATIILSASISQTFFDCIPAIFVGAPDSDTALTVLPGHSLMLDGRGIEAVRLSALGSASSVVVALLLVFPLSLAFSSYYDSVMKYVGVLLLAIALLMIKTEDGPRIEGQGSLVHWKYKALAAGLFLTSGLLGVFAFSREDLLSSPLGLEPQVLLPLLSGIFGASSLLLSLSAGAELPEQKETEIRVPSRVLARSAIFGGLGGSVVAWIPGVSPSVASLCTRLGSSTSAEEFLVSISGVNTANALFSLVALYVIGRPRSGAAAAIQELMAIDQSTLVQMMMVVIAVAAISYLCVIGTAKATAKAMSRVNYRLLCYLVLASLAAMSLLFTGWFGLFIFFLSTLVGLIAPVAGIQRTHAMGVLMLPLIVYYL
jgi:putative membrane protein